MMDRLWEMEERNEKKMILNIQLNVQSTEESLKAAFAKNKKLSCKHDTFGMCVRHASLNAE